MSEPSVPQFQENRRWARPEWSFTYAWAVIGFALFLGWALVRLWPYAAAITEYRFSVVHWLVALLGIAFMLYSEGYRGFQKQFSPRFVTRARAVASAGRLIDRVLAPVYAMGFYAASRRRLIVTWTLTIGIVLAILAFRLIPQPWRGIADVGVICGLAYGLVVTIWLAVAPAIRSNH